MTVLTFGAPDLSGWAGLALLLASFAGSLMTTAVGLGGGVALLAVMASVMPPAALIPVHGAIQMGSNLGRLAVMRREVHWPPFAGFALGAAAGVVLGGLIAVDLPPDLIRVAVGLFVLWSVLARPPVWMGRWPWLTGLLSSILTMFVGATGPFVMTVVRSLALERLAVVATAAALMSLQHALKVAMFALLGFAYGPWLGLVTAMIAAGVLGTLLGRQVLLRTSEGVFGLVLNVVLVALGLRLVWSGLT